MLVSDAIKVTIDKIHIALNIANHIDLTVPYLQEQSSFFDDSVFKDT